MKASRYIFIFALLATGSARADTLYWLDAKLPNGPTWDDGGGDPMKYYVDETLSSAGGLPVENIESEIRQAYQRWQDVDCAYIGFSYQGAITDPAQLGVHADTKSVMGSFVTDRNDARYTEDLASGVAVGVALVYKDNGVILGCDTEYNAFDYTFSDDTPASFEDFPSLANHENGHCLGLDHDPNDIDSVMYPTALNGDMRRTLDAHDIDNVCQLYPETGALGSPCAGTSCASDAGLSCIADPVNGGNFCSQGCVDADPATCPAGFGCRAASEIPGQAADCFPGVGDFSPSIGGVCAQNTDCQGSSALCFSEAADGWPGGYCSQICDSQSCPQGDVCAQLDAQHFYCTFPCTTYQGGCRDGYTCYPSDTSGHGFCYPGCANDGNCPSGAVCLPDAVCYNAGNAASYVGHACNSPADCPTGDYCIQSSDTTGAPSGWPGGYCAGPCGGGQNAARVCDTGSACVIAGTEGEAFCLQTCDSHGGCRQGYTCVVKQDASHHGQQVCAPACATDADCAVGERCSGGACIDPFANDAGQSCSLCGDGGVIQSTSGSAGSTGSGTKPAQPSGCGCNESGLGAAPLALLLLARFRRRRW